MPPFDEDLMDRVKEEDDEDAFSELYERRDQPTVRPRCWNILRNSADVDEASQETWDRVYQKRHTWQRKAGSSFAAWVSGIARNASIDMVKQRSVLVSENWDVHTDHTINVMHFGECAVVHLRIKNEDGSRCAIRKYNFPSLEKESEHLSDDDDIERAREEFEAFLSGGARGAITSAAESDIPSVWLSEVLVSDFFLKQGGERGVDYKTVARNCDLPRNRVAALCQDYRNHVLDCYRNC